MDPKGDPAPLWVSWMRSEAQFPVDQVPRMFERQTVGVRCMVCHDKEGRGL